MIFTSPSHQRAFACLGAARRLSIPIKKYHISDSTRCIIEAECNLTEWDIVYQNAQVNCPQAFIEEE